MIEAVIFDMDGVLIDSEDIYLGWISNYSQAKGYYIPRDTLQKTIGMSSAMCADFFDNLLGKGSGRKFWYEFVEESYTYPFDYQEMLNPGVKMLLEKLDRNGFRIGLASSADRKDIDAMLYENNLHRYFDVVLSGAEFRESKPKPDIYLTAARKLGVSPTDCVVVEDSDYGIEAGKAAGAVVIAIEDTRFGFNQKKADYLVVGMKQIWDILRLISD